MSTTFETIWIPWQSLMEVAVWTKILVIIVLFVPPSGNDVANGIESKFLWVKGHTFGRLLLRLSRSLPSLIPASVTNPVAAPNL